MSLPLETIVASPCPVRRASGSTGSLLVMASVLAFLCTLTAETAAASGIRDGAFTVSLVADGYTFDGKQHLETRPVVGVRGGYQFTPDLAVEALFDYVQTVGTRTDTGDVRVYRYGAELLWNVLPDATLIPVVAAGYGAVTIDPENGSDTTKGMFGYGVGLKQFITSDIAIRGDLRHLIFRAGQTFFNYEYTVGFVYQFGGNEPAPPVAAESCLTLPDKKAASLQPAAAPDASTGEGVVITLLLKFDEKGEILPESLPEAARLGTYLREHPETVAAIEAHTDGISGFDAMLVSQQQAEAVANYLAQEHEIDPSRLSARGHGDTRPHPSPGMNKRVEAVIKRPPARQP